MSMSVGVLLMLGRMILGPLQKLTSKVVKAAVAPFVQAHEALEAADAVVDEADREVHAANIAAAEADEVQDRAVLVLAAALAGDGFNRTNPFKAFGAPAPSKLSNQGALVEAKALTALAAAVLAHPKASAETKRAATDAARAAEVMTDASMRQSRAVAKRSASATARDRTIPGQWRAALTDLKAVVRYADVVDGTDNYVRIFASVNKAIAAAKKKQKTPPPVPTTPIS